MTFIAEALERLARDDPLAAELDSEQAKDFYGFTTTEAKRFLDELECQQLCLLSEGMQMRRRHDRGVRCLLPERDIQDLR